jgi:hypothetical protein
MNVTLLLPLRPGAASLWLVVGTLIGMLAWLRAQPDYVPAQFQAEGRDNASGRDADN